MDTCFASLTGYNYSPDPNDDIMDSLFKQYEHVIVESLISSFGLDFLIKDQHGGDVDTIHNVRQIGNGDMYYKNDANEVAYNNTPEYNKKLKSAYDSDPRFKEINKKYSTEKKEGTLQDAYTGKTVARNANIELDHVISTKEIHEDRGRILAGINGYDLANQPENLMPTDRSINRSMQNKSKEDYCNYLNDKKTERQAAIQSLKEKSELTDKEKSLLHKYEQQEAVDYEKMKQIDATARKSYNDSINRTYYTSKAFRTDTMKAAGTVGIQMGIRQAVGLIFTEVWFAVQDEFDHVQHPFDLSDFLISIGNGIKKGFANAKSKYREILNKFKDGAIAGILSSLTTTICNIFFTTAKNVVKLIRQSYASLVEAAKVLFINPENFPYGERMRATAKILASGASVVVGTIVSEAIGKTGINTIPILNEIVPTFCGTLVTGILTCTLLYYLDRSESMNKLVSVLNTLPTLSTEVDYYEKQAVYFEHYAAELMQIDLEKFKEETTMYTELADSISTAKDQNELNKLLKNAVKTIGIEIPWGDDFNAFMNDKSKVLRFE